MSVPYSRTLFGLIPWYSFLIVLGASVAIVLAVKEEKRFFPGKENIIDLALWVLPFGIIGARIYYVVFSWTSFQHNLLSVLKIWEGGLAIYGAVIAGMIVVFLFSRIRKVPALRLCDLIAPGLVLAQAIGRWGNYFNMEAYGVEVTNPAWQFFPFAVQIVSSSGTSWHMATFFYESVWDLFVFIFLLYGRRRLFRLSGDVFFFYAFLYACGRLVIEEFRTDSLYAASSVRISQLLSVLLCIFILLRMVYTRHRSLNKDTLPFLSLLVSPALLFGVFMVLFCLGSFGQVFDSLFRRFLLLAFYGVINIFSLFMVYGKSKTSEVLYADNKNKESAV